jgi:hypothetical protein
MIEDMRSLETFGGWKSLSVRRKKKMPKSVPLGELEVAVQNAVEQVLGKAGAVPIDRLWVGFVAPENIATQQLADEVASRIGGPGAIGSIASVVPAAAGGVQAKAIPKLHICGYIHQPQ